MIKTKASGLRDKITTWKRRLIVKADDEINYVNRACPIQNSKRCSPAPTGFNADARIDSG